MITNSTYETLLLKSQPSLLSFCSGGTHKLFESEGFLSSMTTDETFPKNVFNGLNKIVLNIVNIAQAVDTFDMGDFGETFSEKLGGISSRMRVPHHKPTTPGWQNLTGKGANLQRCRFQKVEEEFYTINDDFQDYLSMSSADMRRMFSSEYGISEYYAGYFAQMKNAYVIHKHEAALAVIDALLSDEDHPMQDTQKIAVDGWTGTITDDVVINLVRAIIKVKNDMEAAVTTSAYNAAKFSTKQDISRLRILCRTDVLTYMRTIKKLNLPETDINIPIIPVNNFGGIKHYVMIDNTKTYVYPVYTTEDNATVYQGIGEQIGWALTENATEAAYTDGEVEAEDPHENVMMILADKGVVFHIIHNEPIVGASPYNYIGDYLTQTFNARGNEVHGDRSYTFVAFTKDGNSTTNRTVKTTTKKTKA